jgi:amidase
VPFVLKDLLGYTAGDPMHMGTRVLRDVRFTAPHDTYLAQKLRAAGFVFVGRTNTPELGTLPTTEPDAYGASRNPWDTGRSTGGFERRLGRCRLRRHGPAGMRTTAAARSASRRAAAGWSDCGHRVAGRRSRPTSATSGRPHRRRRGDAVGARHGGDPRRHRRADAGRSVHAPPPARPFLQEVGAKPGRLKIGLMSRAPGGFRHDAWTAWRRSRAPASCLESLGHAVEPSIPRRWTIRSSGSTST